MVAHRRQGETGGRVATGGKVTAAGKMTVSYRIWTPCKMDAGSISSIEYGPSGMVTTGAKVTTSGRPGDGKW